MLARRRVQSAWLGQAVLGVAAASESRVRAGSTLCFVRSIVHVHSV